MSDALERVNVDIPEPPSVALSAIPARGREGLLERTVGRWIIPDQPWGRLADVTDGEVRTYYTEAQSYLTGALQGACHFGFTTEGQPFEMAPAQHAMEALLGQTLDLPPGSTVVDAGAGFGRVATTMAKDFGLNVIGVELMPERATEARRFVQERGVSDQVQIVVGNYAHMALPDASADAVYTTETLCHADPLSGALAEFMRVLRPGGRVVFLEYSVPPQTSLDPLRRAVADTMVRKTGMASIWRFTHGAFPKLLTDAGFDEPVVHDISRNVWPHWRWQFHEAIREHGPLALGRMVLNRTLTNTPNLAGSLMIWPQRHLFRYNVITAVKPAASDALAA